MHMTSSAFELDCLSPETFLVQAYCECQSELIRLREGHEEIGHAGQFASTLDRAPDSAADRLAVLVDDRIDLFDDIKVDEARWITGLLVQLTDNQIRDAFRAANYSAEDVEILTETVKSRIAELKRATGGSGQTQAGK